ncbi:MAG: sulfatase-like hydrolase/transferase [Chitinophagaceae bacterium]|nr:sulfatase-like hydrolase/transferase [Chitinophagaceae bacterium]
MRNFQQVFRHRFGPLAVLAMIIFTLSFITRLVLLIKSWPNLELTFLRFLGIFFIGFFYDLVVFSFFAIPVALYCWLMKDTWYQKKWQRIPLFFLFFIITLILVLNVGGEIIFWDEFSVRYNFIAVDYLIYTTEVIGNIIESYNIPLIASAVIAATILILYSIRNKLAASQDTSMRFGKRTVYFLLFMLVPAAGYFLVNNRLKNTSSNNYVNELGGNGIYEFGAAFWNNEIDFNRFYATRNDSANFKILRQMLQAPNATFSSDPLSIERTIQNDSPEHKYNIVLITVESFSGDYFKQFGNTQNITPYIDSLIPYSLWFNRFYATGTRTVRGLEALSLAIPPTPGQSIIRRPENKDMFTIGHVLRSKGYDVNFIYGGNSFFDNMGEYFSNNSYRVLDKSDMPDSLVQLTTAWGVDDGATFDFTIQQCDKSFSNGKPFFNHIMTVSNHRPYMYPEGKIDISPTHQSIEGAVKYTDYAIHKFIKDAQKKAWFGNTLFVIVADHCSKSAGKTDLPVNRYHIPCIIYAPQLIKPSIESRLVSQVDLDPTLLGLMNMNYTSRFLGYDIYKLPAGNERAFISTYQDLGYIKNGRLVILSPQKKIRMFNANMTTGLNTPIITSDSLADEAIAWYQGASFLYHNGKLQK